MYKVKAETLLGTNEHFPEPGSNYNFAGLPGLVLSSYYQGNNGNRLTIELMIPEKEGETVVINGISYIFDTQYDDEGNPIEAIWTPYDE